MSTVNYIKKPVYINDEDGERIISEISNIVDRDLEKSETDLLFRIKDNIFLVNADRFSEETIARLRTLKKIKLLIYKDDIEKKLTLEKY